MRPALLRRALEALEHLAPISIKRVWWFGCFVLSDLIMLRLIRGFFIIAIVVWSQASFALSPNYRTAQNAFYHLSFSDRFSVSMMLIAAGYYNGMSTGDFNSRIFSGLVKFQSAIGAEETGILDEAQRKRLARAGSAFIAPLGLKEFTHPQTNAKLYVPTKLIENVNRTRRGLAFEGATASVDFSFFAPSDATLADLFARLSAPSPSRDVGYKVLRDRFFVVSGGNSERAFYSRYDIGDNGIVGFTLSWAHDVAGGAGGRIAVIMANLFLPRTADHSPTKPSAPEPSLSKAPPTDEKKTGGSGSGFIVSQQGYLLTNAHVVNECKSIAVG